MKTGIRSPSDFWSGLIYIAFGIVVVTEAHDYGMGTALRMGPGYFPTVLGGLLTLIGIVAVVRSLRVDGEPIGRLNLRSMALIAGPIALFAVLLQTAGFLIAMPVLIFGSAYASPQFSLLRTALLALGLTVACYFVFLKGLGIPMPLLGSWFGN